MFTNKLKIVHRTLFKKCCTINLSLKRYLTGDDYKNHLQLFTGYFDLSQIHATEYIAINQLTKFELHEIVKSINFCKDTLGFEDQELLSTPQLFRYKDVALENYSNYLKEAQLALTPLGVGKFRSLIKNTVAHLKNNGCLSENANVVKNFCSHLDPLPPDEISSIEAPEYVSIASIHHVVLVQYLKWRLQICDADVKNMLQTHHQLKNRCFTFVCEMLNIAQSLGLTREKIVKCAYFIRGHPPYTRALLEKHRNIAGADLEASMRQNPKLMMVSPEKMDLICSLLKKYKITDAQIQRHMAVFCLSPETILHRLEELSKDKEFHALRYDMNFLHLVLYPGNVTSKLEYLKQIDMKCFSVRVLRNDDKFEAHVKGGSDVTSHLSLYLFLENLLKIPWRKFNAELRKHPFCHNANYTQVEATFNYLLQEKHFTRTCMSQAVSVLLYPKESLEEALESVDLLEIERNESFKPWTKLHLALYFIERDHHFSGEGVWTGRCPISTDATSI